MQPKALNLYSLKHSAKVLKTYADALRGGGGPLGNHKRLALTGLTIISKLSRFLSILSFKFLHGLGNDKLWEVQILFRLKSFVLSFVDNTIS